MPAQTVPHNYELPALENLLHALKIAFAQHVEVEQVPVGAPLLRLAGLELRVVSGGTVSQELLDAVCARLAEVAAYGVATSFTDESREGTRHRMELISALAFIEASPGATALGAQTTADGDELLTTADVAAQLGMSRPYVSMLCDQGKLGEVTRSEGGHRRIRQSAVTQYKRAHGAHADGTPALGEGTPSQDSLQHTSSPSKRQSSATANKSN